MVFTVYISPHGIIAERYGVKYHLYADDTQLFISLDLDNELNFSSSLNNLENCIADIRLWMTKNVLKLNDTKTNTKYIIRLMAASFNRFNHVTEADLTDCSTDKTKLNG